MIILLSLSQQWPLFTPFTYLYHWWNDSGRWSIRIKPYRGSTLCSITSKWNSLGSNPGFWVLCVPASFQCFTYLLPKLCNIKIKYEIQINTPCVYVSPDQFTVTCDSCLCAPLDFFYKPVYTLDNADLRYVKIWLWQKNVESLPFVEGALIFWKRPWSTADRASCCCVGFPGLVTSCVGTAFSNILLKER
jgi:hypothetical protein